MTDDLKKVPAKSIDLTEQNIEKLKELFPEIISEDKIDFEKLRVILGDQIDESPERYSFTWNGKKQAMKLAQQPTSATLKPNKEKSKNWDTTENLYIEGDNLEVLKLLQKSYFNKIKMIYIDPPYNTGKDFVYKDNFHDSIQNYLEQTGQVDSNGNKLNTNTEASGRYHTDWLNMMYPRLKLARNLLANEGSIFVSIDETEAANIKKLMDEIFGEQNFINNVIWQSRTSISNDHKISLNHNQTLIYAKNYSSLTFGGDDIAPSDYVNPDNDPRGPWKLVPIDANHVGGDTVYPILNPNTGIEYLPPNGRIWAYNRQNFERLLKEGRIAFGMNGQSSPKRKLYYNERIEKGDVKTPSSVLIDAGTTKSGTEEIMNILGFKAFDYPKPSTFVERLIKWSGVKSGLILDFFSGSGTIAEAVLNLNSQDKGTRTYIAVQIPEPFNENHKSYKAGYKTIPMAAQERIRRVGEKIIAENPALSEKLDSGFKVFELAKSNIKKWSGETQNLATAFELLEENFEEGSKPLDVVYEIMLKQGFDLTYPISEHQVGKAVVYDIAYGAMFVVLGDAITSEVAGFIVCKKNEQDREDVVVVLQDEKFVDDSEKLNMIEQLNANGIQYSNILSI